jgi:hypothetical protein
MVSGVFHSQMECLDRVLKGNERFAHEVAPNYFVFSTGFQKLSDELANNHYCAA